MKKPSPKGGLVGRWLIRIGLALVFLDLAVRWLDDRPEGYPP